MGSSDHPHICMCHGRVWGIRPIICAPFIGPQEFTCVNPITANVSYVHLAREEILDNCGTLGLKSKVTFNVSDFCEAFLAALLICSYFGNHCSFV